MTVLSESENKILRKVVPSQLADRTYIVGGAVRDIILGLSPKDIDFVVENSTHEEMISLNSKQVGNDFPVYLIKDCEFALCRQERKNGNGYNGFETCTKNVSLEKDLQRRDLTINAMGISNEGFLIDPFNGMKDLENKILKHVSESFSEDPLRVLRLARFTARFTDFSIHGETINLAKSLRNELMHLVPERVFKETEKALKEERPSNFFRSLVEMDVLDIIFPELHRMIGLNHNPKHHAEGDVFEHTMRVLDAASKLSNDPIVRFAAIFHDIGKPLVHTERGTFHGHSEEALVFNAMNELKDRLKIPNSYMELAIIVAKSHHKVHDLEKMSHQGLRRFLVKDLPKNKETLDKMILSIKADELGRITSLDGPMLSKEEADLLFLSDDKIIFINELEYRIPNPRIDEVFLHKLHEVKVMKSEVGSVMKDATIPQKKAFIERELSNRVKSVMNKCAN
jgi:tRNA nucleotidyltransferase (CCA-adding enzyme)